MRYAQNLAEYEQGIADGIIDENVFVIVLEEKVAKFKGQTFDWSSGFDTSSLATKEELNNLTNEMVANEEVHAAAYTDLDSRLKDIGSLISGVAVTKEEFQEGLQSITDEIIANEEVAAASLNDLEERKADKDYVEQYVEDAITSAITTTLNTEV